KRRNWTTSSVKRPTAREAKYLASIWQYAEKDPALALEIVTKGVRWAASEERWAEDASLAFEELMVNDKAITYYRKFNEIEARKASHNRPLVSTPSDEAAEPPSPPTAPHRPLQKGDRVWHMDGYEAEVW